MAFCGTNATDVSVLSGDCVSGDVRTTIKNGDHAEGGKNMGESIFHWENGMSWDKIHSKSMKAYVRVIWTCQKLFSWSTPIRINPNWTTRKLPVGLILFGLGLPIFWGKFQTLSVTFTLRTSP